MSALGRFFARLFGRRREPTLPVLPPLDVAREAPVAETPLAAPLMVEPRSELAVTPALGAAGGEAELIAAEAGVELVGESAPLAEDEEDVFEEEEPSEDAGEDGAAGPGLDRKIAMREAAVPYLRQVAEEEALAGEHRVRPTDPSGPGTLAEALARLESEGRLHCELEEDAEGAPILVYRPRPGN